MRYLLFHRPELYDIGRVVDGYILCSAGWGLFPKPLLLPPPQIKEANGDLLWPGTMSNVDPRLVIDMASRENAIVFTAPTYFKAYSSFDSDFSALVLTKDKKHIFQAFGGTRGLLDHFPAAQRDYEFGPALFQSACDTTLDVCVVAKISHVSSWRRDQVHCIERGILGALAACLLCVLVIHRQQNLRSLPEQVRRAIADGNLDVRYQPLMRLRDRRLVGVEALARLTDTKGEFISPEIFIAIAEESGLIKTVSRQVIHKALRDMRPLLFVDKDFQVGINITATDIVDPKFLVFLNNEVESLGISPAQVAIELTERSTADSEQIRMGAENVRSNGYSWLIDDFGIGHFNLSYLATLPMTGIKIDRMFTHSMAKDTIMSSIVEKIVSLSKTLNVTVIVEGIEEEEQASYVLALCPNAIGQGWLFGKPVKAEQIIASQKGDRAA